MIEQSSPSRFSPRSQNQKDLITSIYNNSITLAIGPPGVGKTALSVQTLLSMLSEKKIRKIIVIRHIADTFDEHLGALPGEMDEKMIVYLGAILDNLYQLRTKSQIKMLLEKGELEAIPVSQVRGRTFIDCGIIIEESQNMSPAMQLACLTRIGERTKMVLTCDPEQDDFAYKKRYTVQYLENLLSDMKDVGVVKFDDSHIERHPIIIDLLKRHREITA